MATEPRFVPFLPGELDYERMSTEQIRVLYNSFAAEIRRRRAAEALGQGVGVNAGDNVVAGNVVEANDDNVGGHENIPPG